MPVRAVDDKPSDTLVVVSGEGFWTGSSTLPHLHHHIDVKAPPEEGRGLLRVTNELQHDSRCWALDSH